MKKPYRYQEDVVKCSVEYFRDNDRGKIILPCGSGKTLISLWIHEALNSKLTIVLVPSISLIKQTKDNWKSEKSVDFDYLCICSSQDVDEDDDEEYSLDFIEEYSCKVTTNSNVIKKFLLLDKSKNKVIFSTYQSLNKVIEAVKDEDLIFDLAICDEAHRTAGEIFNLKITNFKKIHSNDNIKVKKRLYMTATPRVVNTEYYNINDDDKKNDENICSVSLSRLVKNMTENVFNMDDVKTFGNVIYQMSFQKAIDENILVDYKIVGVGVSDRQIEEYIKSGKVVDKNISYQDIMDNYACNLIMEKYNLKHAITFHSKIKKAENFCERHKQFFKNFDSYCISSKIDSDKRNEIMFNFKNSEKSLISNARCLSEGVDIPNVDMIFYSNIKKSTIDIVQSAGRALRKYKDKNGKEKEFGYIVIPIYYQEKPNNFDKFFNDTSEKVEYEVEGTNKKIQIRKKDLNEMINIIKKIGDEDERIESYINLSFLKFQNKNNKKETEEESEEDKKNSIILENFNDKQIEKAILERIIKRSYKSWSIWYIELRNSINNDDFFKYRSFFKNMSNMTFNINNTNKKTKKIIDKIDKIKELNNWIRKQEKLFINNELEDWKINKLLEIPQLKNKFSKNLTEKTNIEEIFNLKFLREYENFNKLIDSFNNYVFSKEIYSSITISYITKAKKINKSINLLLSSFDFCSMEYEEANYKSIDINIFSLKDDILDFIKFLKDNIYNYSINSYVKLSIKKENELLKIKEKNDFKIKHLELTEETKIIKTEYNAEVKLIREKINNYFKKRNIIELNDIITLKKDNGQIFKIKIVDSNSCIDDDITIVNKNTLYGESLIGVALNEIVDIEKKNSIESIEILKIEKAK